MAEKIDKDFWENRYAENEIGWDIGHVSDPIKGYIDQLKDKTIKILIPGCGNSYEAEYFFKNGFKNVFVADYTLQPLKNLAIRIPDFPQSQLLHSDFFAIDNKFDLIIEQTFFCALDPIFRKKYVLKMTELLAPKGKLVGLLFDDVLNSDKPPFGGNKEEYMGLFEPFFTIQLLERCTNSIKPREGRELFMILEKK